MDKMRAISAIMPKAMKSHRGSGWIVRIPNAVRPGDPCPGFIAQPDRCWRMVYDHNLQAAHCRGQVEWHGRWFSPKGDRWWRVAACERHIQGLTGLRRQPPQLGSQRHPLLSSQVIDSPSPARPVDPWSEFRQYSPGS